MLTDYPFWKLMLIEVLILSVAGAHALLLNLHGTKRTQRAVNRGMSVLGMLATLLLVGCVIALLSLLMTVGLLRPLAKQPTFNIKVILELAVQLFGLLSLGNILLPALVKDLRTSLGINLLAGALLVIGATCGNLFKLYVSESAFKGIGPVLSAVGFVTSFLTICTLLGYAGWLAVREREVQPSGAEA